MNDLFSKCGFNCRRCPSFKTNIRNLEDRTFCSDGWKKYHGFRITAQKIRLCDGCQTPDEKNPVLYISCRVRRCALGNGARTCAHCSIYPCEDVLSIGSAGDLIEKTRVRLKTSIPAEDYAVFIEPYEGIKHLDRIRLSLRPQDIVDMKPVSLKTKVFDFPENLGVSRKKTAAYKALHVLLRALNRIESVSFARKEALNWRRQHLLKILWGFGLRGQFSGEADRLEMSSGAYREQMLLSYPIEKVEGLFKAFEEFGVHCRFVSQELDKWLTPTRALRPGDWKVKMSLSEEMGGAAALKVLKEYSKSLDNKFGEAAYKHFVQANMSCLEKASDRGRRKYG